MAFARHHTSPHFTKATLRRRPSAAEARCRKTDDTGNCQFERIKRAGLRAGGRGHRAQILAGRLKPGDPVGTESELVKQFGVNRSTCARASACSSSRPRRARAERGCRCSAALPPPRQPHDARVILQQVTFRELWHTSRALEPAGRSGHGQCDGRPTWPSWRPTSPRRAAAARSANVAELDAEFHKLIGKAAHNACCCWQGALGHAGAADHRPDHRQQPQGIPPDRSARHILDALQRRDREKAAVGRPPSARLEGRLRRSGRDLDTPSSSTSAPAAIEPRRTQVASSCRALAAYSALPFADRRFRVRLSAAGVFGGRRQAVARVGSELSWPNWPRADRTSRAALRLRVGRKCTCTSLAPSCARAGAPAPS